MNCHIFLWNILHICKTLHLLVLNMMFNTKSLINHLNVCHYEKHSGLPLLSYFGNDVWWLKVNINHVLFEIEVTLLPSAVNYTDRTYRGPFYYSVLTEIRTWIRNYIHCFLLGVITHPCPNLNSNQAIDVIHKSHNALVPYPTMQHSEQKCTHFCSEWCIVEYGTGALHDGICEMVPLHPIFYMDVIIYPCLRSVQV